MPISKIKVEVDKRIEVAFARDGQISIGELYDFLEETYGFAPCNLSSFIAGFLLKEYGSKFRFQLSLIPLQLCKQVFFPYQFISTYLNWKEKKGLTIPVREP